MPLHAYRDKMAHTYSIVAHDPLTGEMGVAVQSHWFSVGKVVGWGEAGVGIVATQSMTNPSFGPRGLELLRGGLSPKDIVADLIGSDQGREVRQLAVLDASGRAAAYTGSRCIPHCGHLVGEHFSVQANMMVSDEVWPSMASAFQSSEGPLAERMMAAMAAAESSGGDFRGHQSASLLVVRARPIGRLWEDRAIDLRVEDHTDPVGEMSRLLRIHRAYELMNEGDLAQERGDISAALKHYEAAQERYPENEEMTFWHAAMLVSDHRMEEALPLFAKVFRKNAHWRDILPSMSRLGHIDLDEDQLKMLMRL